MEWFIRLLMGLPPRKGSDDVKSFNEAFPEVYNDKNNLLKLIDRLDWPFHPRSYHGVHKDWFTNEKENRDISFAENLEECEVNGCPLKSKINRTSKKDSNPFYELVVGPLGHLNDKSEIDEFVDKILGFFDLESVPNEFIYIDPYLYKSCFPNKITEKNKESVDFSKEFVKKLSSRLNSNITFISSDIQSNNESIEEGIKFNLINVDNDISKFPFHDRFLIQKSEEDYCGIIVGNSINSFKSNRHFVISKLDDGDVKIIYEIQEKLCSTNP